MNKKLLKEQNDLVKKFNEQFKIGDKVNFKSSKFSEPKQVTVKTEAWIQHDTAVVMFEEVRSYCSIEPMFVEYKEKENATIVKESQFREIKFKSDKKFKEWLKENTDKKLILKDLGQDLQTIWIHRTGEILNCDFHMEMYVGKFVNLDALEVNEKIQIWDNGKKSYKPYGSLIIEEIK